MTKNLRKSPWKQINKEWLPEIIVTGGLIVGALYFLIPPVARISLVEEAKEFANPISDFGKWLTTPTNIIALILVVGIGFFVVKRLRYHLLRLTAFDQTCPVCHHQTHRRHRKAYHRFLSAIVPLRRYYCRNCGWKGLRVYHKRKLKRSR